MAMEKIANGKITGKYASDGVWLTIIPPTEINNKNNKSILEIEWSILILLAIMIIDRKDINNEIINDCSKTNFCKLTAIKVTIEEKVEEKLTFEWLMEKLNGL